MGGHPLASGGRGSFVDEPSKEIQRRVQFSQCKEESQEGQEERPDICVGCI